MFERFTERARQVIVLAQEEALALMHDHIGTEHLLLGLLREQQGGSARVLESLGVTVERVRADVTEIVGGGTVAATAGQIPFTPRAKRGLENGLREALHLGHGHIATEHLLLGLLREGRHEEEGGAIRILRDLDADPEEIRRQLYLILPRSPSR